MNTDSKKPGIDLSPVLDFLPCRTPVAWVEQATRAIDSLLNDHAALELKAALSAQKLIRRYGAKETRSGDGPGDNFRSKLINAMSRLAREELRHFEQVVDLIEQRGGRFSAVSPSRYAAGLHELARRSEPGALIDALIIGAVIEARSCERFFSLTERPGSLEEPLLRFYSSLLRSEARHFENYLGLARDAGEAAIDDRIAEFLARDAELVQTEDTRIRFLSGALRQPSGSVNQAL